MATEATRRESSRETMPPAARRLALGAAVILVLGALYLISVRGQALLLDLTAFSQQMFCW